MTTVYVKSGQAIPWVNSRTWSTGEKMVPVRNDQGTNFRVARQWVWECTTAGTAAAANPTWPASVTKDTTTVTSGGATFTAREPGYSSGSTQDWAFGAAYLDYVLPTASGRLVGGDRVKVSNNHSENSALGSATYDGVFTSAGTPTNPIWVECVDETTGECVTTPTAVVKITGSGTVFTPAGSLAMSGLIFEAGTSGVSCGFTCAGSAVSQSQSLENCAIRLIGNGGVSIGTSSSGGRSVSVRWRNVTVRFYANSYRVLSYCDFQWTGGGIESGGAAPNALLYAGVGAGGGLILAQDLDLQNLSPSGNICYNYGYGGSRVTVRNCVMPANWTGDLVGNFQTGPGARYAMFACDSAGGTGRMAVAEAAGIIVNEGTITRAGGEPESWKITAFGSPAGGEWPTSMLTSFDLMIWIPASAVGVQQTATIYAITDDANAQNNLNFFMELDYYGASGNPQGSHYSGEPATFMSAATDHTSDSSTWNNTGGMTNPNKIKMTCDFTPQLEGFALARIKYIYTTNPLYVDSAIYLT